MMVESPALDLAFETGNLSVKRSFTELILKSPERIDSPSSLRLTTNNFREYLTDSAKFAYLHGGRMQPIQREASCHWHHQIQRRMTSAMCRTGKKRTVYKLVAKCYMHNGWRDDGRICMEN